MKDIVYGLHAVTALIKNTPGLCECVYIENRKKNARTAELIKLLELHSVRYQRLSAAEFNSRAGDVVHQGVFASVIRQFGPEKNKLDDILPQMSDDETILILDGVVDPANLGACLRAADAAGVATVIMPKDKSAPVSAVTRKVAAGAAESVRVVIATNLARTIETLKANGFWIFGLADETARSLYDQPFDGRVAVVMGNEGKGLRRLTRESCDQLLSIPMMGQVESLNVAVATGITLYEVHRQRIAQK